ncbi:bifunctional metallophosphatase/5'-nucleotidase [Magnetococcales bacterium HHB-1]
MKKTLCTLISLLLLSSITYADQAKELTIIHLGDLHGHLIPRPNMRIDDPDFGQKVGGLAYVYDQIKKIRQKHQHTLLINTGDTIQGSAETLFSKGEAIVTILNQWNIDGFVPGNWDFLYGTEAFIHLFAGANDHPPKANWNSLAANLYYATLYQFPETHYASKAGQRVLSPYLIKEINGLKVGMIGLTADRGPQAVSTHVMDGFFLTPGEEELASAIKKLREQEKVDLLLLLSERGLAANLELVETYPGVDIVLSSDMHEETHKMVRAKSGTLLVEEGQDGTLVGELNLKIKNRQIVEHTWTAHRINQKNNQPDEKVQEQIEKIRRPFIAGNYFIPHVNPINTAVLRTPIDTTIGFTKHPLHRSNFSDAKVPAVIEGSSHHFLGEAFRYGCQSDIGIMRGFRYGTHIAPGPIKLEDIYHFIPIGPQIACGYMSGDQIKEQLKQGASGSLSRFIGYWGGGWLTQYTGIRYDLDPYNEFGYRVQNIRINNDPIDLEKMYSVAGYWFLENPDRINRFNAENITVLKNGYGGVIDAVDIVALYLRNLPDKTVTQPHTGFINLLKPLPEPLFNNKEIQPLQGMPRPDF